VEVTLHPAVTPTASSTGAQHPLATASVHQEGSFAPVSWPLAALLGAPPVDDSVGASGVRDDLVRNSSAGTVGGRVAGHDETHSGKEGHRDQNGISVHGGHDVYVVVVERLGGL